LKAVLTLHSELREMDQQAVLVRPYRALNIEYREIIAKITDYLLAETQLTGIKRGVGFLARIGLYLAFLK